MEKTAHPALHKVRRIYFSSLPPPNFSHAMKLLGELAQLQVSVDADDGCLSVRYDLSHHTLEVLEDLLVNHGHHLDNSLLHKIKRALIYHSESCILENLRAPSREQHLRSIYLSSAHSPEHRPNTEPADEYLDRL
ncbi:MAG: hypothetical protein KJ958_08030 [Gammaproteobacteria bacterium]|nr:hypothetical protein [Gammaproteobacteria bacterium]MBU1979099.1 hypothetical protein [Gammaproteobacteria bacterium]